MWKCKHCNKTFDLVTTSEKANHSRWCDKNPKRNEWNKTQGTISKFGKKREYKVECYSCGKNFEVLEREKLHPQKEYYFCSRSCANSMGGKAKVEKYGYSSYGYIASFYHEKKCAVCGIEDVLDVHHIDENRNNNHPSNLIFLCPNDHARVHRNKDERVLEVIKGHGTAWGGRFLCTEDIQ